MKTISEIYDKIYQDNSTKDSKKFLSILESEHELLLVSNFDSYDDRYKTTRLISDYSLHLSNNGFVKRSISFMNHAIALFESDEKLRGKDLLNEPLFEALIWKRGENYYNLKKFSLAKRDFKRLLTKWPENDRFKNWYNASACYRLNQLGWGFVSLIVFCFVVRYILEYKTSLTIYGNFIGTIGYITTYIYKMVIKIK